MSNRRNFIKLSGLASLTSSLPWSLNLLAKSPRRLNILILGGTGFLGPHVVSCALKAGHQVTLFNRGKTNPNLFTQLKTIIGDRNTSDIEKLSGYKWDAVIDTSAYFPRSVNMAMQVLKPNIKQYLLVSTISVYADWSQPGLNEDSALATISDPTLEDITNSTYGALKALCEAAAQKHMPGKVCTIRPGLIVGPRDKTDRFTYWPVRVKQGGEFIAPGTGDDFIQFIDVRDLAEWMLLCLEKNINGTYNAQTQAQDIRMKDLINSCMSELNPKAQPVYIPAEFLAKHQVTPWQEMPVWFPPTGDFAGAGAISTQRAHAKGLTHRPIGQTVKDCYAWFSQLPKQRQSKLRAGISLVKEKRVLSAWKKSSSPIEKI
ncbi:NAD-dependent epimerase/dehydratase family protein [Aliikangiella sp. IMCC44632]